MLTSVVKCGEILSPAKYSSHPRIYNYIEERNSKLGRGKIANSTKMLKMDPSQQPKLYSSAKILILNVIKGETEGRNLFMQNYWHTVHKLMEGNSNKNKDAPIKPYTATHNCKNNESN